MKFEMAIKTLEMRLEKLREERNACIPRKNIRLIKAYNAKISTFKRAIEHLSSLNIDTQIGNVLGME